MNWCARKEDSHGTKTERASNIGGMLRRGGIALLVGSALLGAAGPTARAAENDRYQYVEDLLRSLVESEVERYESNKADQNLTLPNRKRPSQQLTQARPLLTKFSSEATALTKDLDRQLDWRPTVRPIFGDLLRLRARAYVVSKNSWTTSDHELIATDYATMSADWQSLSYQLRRIRGLDVAVTQHIDALDGIDRDLAAILQITGRIDRQAVLSEFAQVKAELHNLLTSIETEIERSPQRRQLIATGNQLEQQVDQIAAMVNSTAPYDTIIAECRELLQAWYPYASSLRALNNRTIERHVRRIEHCDYQLHALLRLPHQIDRERLLNLTNSLMQQVDEFYLRAPLKLLITLRNGSEVIPTCNQFYGVCEHFADSLQNGADHEALIEDYRYVDEAWIAFNSMFRELNSSKAQAVLDDIERGVVSLRESLQLIEGFDRDEAVNLAASLVNYAEDFDSDLHKWLDRNNRPFGKAALKETHDLLDAARQFHDHLVAGADPRVLQRESRELSARWERVHEYVRRCDGGDRYPLLRTSAKITPLVVELETKLEV